MIQNQAIIEINKIINGLPENKLEDLLLYLKQIESSSKEENYDGFIHAVDKEDISKSTIMAANLKKTIIEVLLDENKNLTIDFENGSTTHTQYRCA